MSLASFPGIISPEISRLLLEGTGFTRRGTPQLLETRPRGTLFFLLYSPILHAEPFFSLASHFGTASWPPRSFTSHLRSLDSWHKRPTSPRGVSRISDDPSPKRTGTRRGLRGPRGPFDLSTAGTSDPRARAAFRESSTIHLRQGPALISRLLVQATHEPARRPGRGVFFGESRTIHLRKGPRSSRASSSSKSHL